jgi:hypothetical protein
VIDEVARDGGYIMDASAIIQNDATIENMQVLTDFTREYGVYSGSSYQLLDVKAQNIPAPGTIFGAEFGMANHMKSKVKPGLCIPWEEKRKEIPSITGDEPLVKQIWEDVDSFGNMFIWQCLLSF